MSEQVAVLLTLGLTAHVSVCQLTVETVFNLHSGLGGSGLVTDRVYLDSPEELFLKHINESIKLSSTWAFELHIFESL